MNDIAIIAEHLSHQYTDFQAVSDISFEINRGEIFGLLGPNGAGKSTTISMLSGLVTPTKGTILIAGKTFKSHSNELKKMIGVVPQSIALYETLTALDNLAFFSGIYCLNRQQRTAAIERVLEIVGLTTRANDVVATYSGGMKRRLNLAVALLHQPSILFLDEPTVGVDPQSRNHIFEAIEKLNKQGLTVIYTTHYMEEAERLCNRVAIMDQGKIIILDTPKALCKSIGEGFFRVNVTGNSIHEIMNGLKNIDAITDISVQGETIEIQAGSLQEALTAFWDFL